MRVVQVTDIGSFDEVHEGGAPPAASRAVIVNLTAANAAQNGYITMWESGTRPDVSHLNYSPGRIASNTVIVPINSDAGLVNIFASGDVDLIVDVQGWITI